MPGLSTAEIYAINNDLIKESGSSLDSDGYFYSLCNLRVKLKKRKCLNCPKTFLSRHYGHRLCPKCGEIKGPTNGKTQSYRSKRA